MGIDFNTAWIRTGERETRNERQILKERGQEGERMRQ